MVLNRLVGGKSEMIHDCFVADETCLRAGVFIIKYHELFG